MSKDYWKISEVIEVFEVSESLLTELEEEDIICPICREDSSEKFFTSGDLERLRLVKTLMEDMGVNLPGIDIILRMRQNMIEIRQQFDTILEDIARHFKETIGE